MVRWTLTICGCMTLLAGSPSYAQAPVGIPLSGGAAGNAAAEEPAEEEAADSHAEPQAISPGEVSSAAEADLATVDAIETQLSLVEDIDAVEASLPRLKRVVDARWRESKQLLDARSSIESLRTLEDEWEAVGAEPDKWNQQLSSRLQRVEGAATELGRMHETWRMTRAAAQTDGGMPHASRLRIDQMLAAVGSAREQCDQLTARLLTLQDRVTREKARITEGLELVVRTRSQAIARILNQSAPPLWAMVAQPDAELSGLDEGRQSLTRHASVLLGYADRNRKRVVLHGLLFVAALLTLLTARRSLRVATQAEPALPTRLDAFETPIATAALLALTCGTWIYPQAPRMLSAGMTVLSLLPTFVILRRLLQPSLAAALCGLLTLQLFEQLRIVASSTAWVSRVSTLVEAALGALLAAWLVSKRSPARECAWSVAGGKALITTARLALVTLSLSMAANVTGFVELATLLASTTLSSAFDATLLYAMVKTLESLVISALRLDPFRKLAMIRRHRALVERRLSSLLRIGAWALWTLELLDRVALRKPLFAAIDALFSARSDLGSLRVSLGDLLVCVIALTSAFLLWRSARFVLDEEVYPRLNLPQGVPYALSRLLRYGIMTIGIFVAVAAAGVDLSRLTILASAVGIGVGFGLQHIVGNFVSGLILLFERPVRMGDAVQIADISGIIERIGFRASVVRLPNGARMIVPNTKFITERVTSRLLLNPELTIDLRVVVAYGSDPLTVVELLQQIAVAHPQVRSDPPPQVLFSQFDQYAVYFTLRCSVDHPSEFLQTKSELGIEIERLYADGRLSAPIPAMLPPPLTQVMAASPPGDSAPDAPA